MKKVLFGIFIVGIIIVFFTYGGFKQFRTGVDAIERSEGSKMICLYNKWAETDEVFYSCQIYLINYSHKPVEFQIKLKPKNTKLISLIGEEVSLGKKDKNGEYEKFKIEPRTSSNISKLLETHMKEEEFKGIQENFDDFYIIIYNNNDKKIIYN